MKHTKSARTQTCVILVKDDEEEIRVKNFQQINMSTIDKTAVMNRATTMKTSMKEYEKQ